MRYYPISKVITGLVAKEGEFSLNGSAYQGPYYVTYDGKAYPGALPLLGGNTPLTALPQAINTSVPQEVTLTENTSRISSTGEVTTYGTFTAYLPSPTKEDYKKGYFIRYFSKKFNDPSSIVEISKQTHDDFLGPNLNQYDTILYKVTSMFWQLTGPLRTTRVSDFNVIPGIIDTNKRLTLDREKEFSGIIAYIGEEYTYLAVPTK